MLRVVSAIDGDSMIDPLRILGLQTSGDQFLHAAPDKTMDHVGGWLTIFNLIPIWQLDGSRGFHALARAQRWIVVLIVALLWWIGREGLLVLLALVAGLRAMGNDAPKDGDPPAFAQYVSLVALSLLLASIHVPIPGQ